MPELAGFYYKRRRRKRWLVDIITIGILLALVVLVARCGPGDRLTSGIARVVDGDTISIDGISIRLTGIDAPERRQICHATNAAYKCGLKATRALRDLIGNVKIWCKGWQYDKYQRLVAECYKQNPKFVSTSLNQLMVRNGWALSYGKYIKDEALARKEKRGIWAGRFQMPSDWRAENKSGTASDENLIDFVWHWLKNHAGLPSKQP